VLSPARRGAQSFIRVGGVRDVESALRAITAVHGVFLRREAVEVGLEDRVLRRERRHGQLVKVRHGAYAFSDEWAALDDVGRHVVLTRAAMRTLGDRAAASHHSGCALHGMSLWDVPLEVAHVTRLDDGSGRQERDIRHHQGLVLPEDVVLLDGFQVMRPVRAALESAMLSGVERGLVTVNSGLHSGLFDPDALATQHALMQSWPDSQHLHVITRLADGRVESVGESRSLFLFWSQGVADARAAVRRPRRPAPGGHGGLRLAGAPADRRVRRQGQVSAVPPAG
jgi:hypothetical protein